MQDNLITITIMILIGVFLSELVAIYQLHKLKGNINNGSNHNTDYFDLKLRLHSLQLTVIFATFLIVFLGWNIREQIVNSIKTEISGQIEPDIESIKSKADFLKSNYDSLNIDLTKKISEVNQLSKNYAILMKDYDNLNNLMNRKIEHLSTLLNIYLVPNLVFDFKKDSTKYYFNNLIPVNAKKLPEFKTLPFISIQTDWGLGLHIDMLTKDYNSRFSS